MKARSLMRQIGVSVAAGALVFLGGLGMAPTAAQAAPETCGLVVEIIAAPYAAVDSNKPGVDGPQVAMLGARIHNTSGLPLKDVKVAFNSTALAVLNSGAKAYFLNDLLPGSSVTAYWPITYPATYNKGYPYTIAVEALGGCSASSSSRLTTQSEIGATANKLRPVGSTLAVTPEVVTLGGLMTVRLTGFTLGTVGQGPNGMYDAWLQPLGNLDFDPTCLRLVRSEVKLGSISATPFIDRLYFTGLRSYQANAADYVAYTFIALRSCATNIRPYQEAASGTQEKYNADYQAITSRVGMTSTSSTALQVAVQPDRTMVQAEDTVRFTINYSSTGSSVGYPANGNPVVLYAALPGQTSYVAGSATESGRADAEFSSDGGSTWATVEPVDPGVVTDLRWLINEPVTSAPGQVEMNVSVDANYSGTPLALSVTGALYDGPALVSAGTTVKDAAGNNVPTANDDDTRTNTGAAVTFSVTGNDTDADGNLVAASAAPTRNPGHGAVSSTGAGVFTYMPLAGYVGPDSFAYKVCDDAGACDEATVIIYVGKEKLTWTAHTTYVAYEDLKGAGWSDWDYNDFIVAINAAVGVDARGRVAAIEVDYDALARGAGYTERFLHDVPVEGGGLAMVSVFDSAGALLARRTATFDSNTNFTIFERTVDALPPLAGFFDTNTRSTQSEVVAGRKAKLTIYVNMPDNNLVAALPPAPWDPYIYVYYTKQEIHLPVPGHMDNTQVVNPRHDAASPLVGYDLPLAQIIAPGWRWPEEFRGIWRGFPQYTNFVSTGGTTHSDWWREEKAVPAWLWKPRRVELGQAAAGSTDAVTATATVTSRYFAGPVAADLDGDGWNEIVIGNLLANRVEVMNVLGGQAPGWPQPVSGGVKAPVTVADLDGDGRPELLAGSEAGQLHAWRYNGQSLEGWPIVLHAGFRILAAPAVGDLTGDAAPEIIVPVSDGKLYVLDAGGSILPGWPASMGDVADLYGGQVINSAPRLVDLHGDGRREIVVGSTDKRVYVFNGDGSLHWVYPTDDMVHATPAIGEIHPSVPGLEIVVGSGDRYVYLLDARGNLIWRRPTGWTVRSSPVLADLDGDGAIEVVVGSDDDRIWVWRHNGELVGGWPQAAGADILSSPQVGDLDGDGEPEIVVGADDAKVWAWHVDGTLVDTWPRSMHQSVKGAPLLANLDDDALLEVAATDLAGTMQRWNVDAISFKLPVYLPVITRGQ